MKNEHRNCKEFLMANSRSFGITESDIGSECLDICARNVRFIAARTIDERIVLPSMSNFLNSCTGLVDTACGIDTGFASLRITHASEKLVDCDENCAGVRVVIRGQIIVRTSRCNSCSPSYMAIPVELVNEVIRDFYSACTGERVRRLKEELPFIDGSCMVINLHCRIRRETCNGSSRFVAHVRGSVVDKLWKQENIWVEGIRPYKRHAVTVCDEFSKDINTDNGGDCIRFGNSRMNDCDDDGDDCDRCTVRRNCCDDDCGCARNNCSTCCDDDCGCARNNCNDCCDDDCGCAANNCNTCCDDCGSVRNNCSTCCDDDCGCAANNCDDSCDDDCNRCERLRCDCDDECDDGCDDDCDDWCRNSRRRNNCDDNCRRNSCDDDCDDWRRNGRCRGEGPYVYSGEA